MAWFLVAVACGAAFSLFYWAHLRVRVGRPLRDVAPGRSVSELTAGRFRVVGKIVPLETSRSHIDESPCVFIERAIYRTVGSELVPFLKQVSHVERSHPFLVDDGTGRVRIDPRVAIIDALTLTEDEGLLRERRLRAGEEVEVIARFSPRETDSDGGPYRGAGLAWEAVDDEGLPPQVGYRAVPLPVRLVDETTTFLRGLGAVLMLAAASLVLATLF